MRIQAQETPFHEIQQPVLLPELRFAMLQSAQRTGEVLALYKRGDLIIDGQERLGLWRDAPFPMAATCLARPCAGGQKDQDAQCYQKDLTWGSSREAHHRAFWMSLGSA